MVQQSKPAAASLNFWVRSRRCREEILELHETASKLELQTFAASETVQFGDAHLQDCITAVDLAENKALHCREHLAQHILSLTTLSDLAQEDRVARIIAVEQMEKMLQVNDSTQATLAGLRKQLQVRLKEALQLPKDEAAEVLQQTRTSELDPCSDGLLLQEEESASISLAQMYYPIQASLRFQCTCLCAQCGKIACEGCLGDGDFAGHWFCAECWQEWDTCDEFSVGSDEDSFNSEGG